MEDQQMSQHPLGGPHWPAGQKRAMWQSSDLPYLIALALIVFGSIGVEHVVGRQTVEATVTRLDAPRSCRARSIPFVAMRQRSEAPRSPFGYCGIVMTDHGSFILPETNRPLSALGFAARETLHDALQEGCRFELTVSGWGDPLTPGAPARNEGNRTLRRAELAGPCAEATP
jgi:hypothetical protein